MHILKLGFASIIQCVLLSFVFLTSCRKNAVEAPVQDANLLQSTNDVSSALSKEGSTAIPFEKTVFVSCANGGNGEDVKLTGASKVIYQITWNDRGLHLVFHESYHGVAGSGLISNESFTASGKAQGVVSGSWENSRFVRTMIQEVRISGQSTKFTVRYTLHITVNPDGSVSFRRENETTDCTIR